jgi:hypothetical protein
MTEIQHTATAGDKRHCESEVDPPRRMGLGGRKRCLDRIDRLVWYYCAHLLVGIESSFPSK